MGVLTGASDRGVGRWVADWRPLAADRRLRALVVVAVGWLLAFALLTVATAGAGHPGAVARSVVALVPLAVAGVLAGEAARRLSGRDRTYWVALAVFCGLRLAGELVGVAAGTGSEGLHGRGALVAGSRLVQYLPAVVAAALVCGRPTQVNGLRGFFDLAMVSVAAFYLTWEVGVVPALGRDGSVSVVLDATTPALDNLILIVAVSAAIGAREHVVPARFLVLAAFTGLLAVDSLWSVVVDIRGGGSTWFALAYQLPPALLVVGAVTAWRQRDPPTRARALSSRLPMMSITISCSVAVVVASSHAGHRGRDVLVSAVAVTVVVVRAVLANTELRATAVRLERARGEQERLAVTDGLTGLYNRRFFEEFLRLETGRSVRTGLPVSLIVADLDHFKRVNDAFGHPVGDRVLIEVARRLRAAVRGSDVVARYGGEEFAVVLPETDPAAALEIAERCRQALHEAAVTLTGDPAVAPRGSAPASGDGPGVVVSGSFGVATLWAIGDVTVVDLVRAADRALYRAKATGRNRVAPAGEWDFLTPTDAAAPEEADPVADALFRAAELLDADRSPNGFGAAVGDWAGVLADHLGLDARTRARCVLAGHLRDLGKLAIPRSVLSKPGPLTDAEWALVRTHPEHSEALVALAPSVTDLGAVVRAHHERVDGSGYPDHLTGAEIPLEARIVAVCDAWAAMRTTRAYAAARSAPDSRREITRGAGTQFDQDIAEAFLTLQNRGAVGAPAGPGRVRTTTPAADIHTADIHAADIPAVAVHAADIPGVAVLSRGTVTSRVAAIATQPHEHAVLERLVEAAQELVPARYAVALLVGSDGIPTALAHRGMAPADVAALPHLPRPVGLVGTVLAGQTLHLTRLADHPDSVGFPTGHVPMGPLLGIPVTVDGRVQGGLYLTRAPGEPAFTDDAERVADALTHQAGSVIAGLRTAAAARIQLQGPTLTGNRATRDPDAAQVSPVIRQILANARAVLGVDLTLLTHIAGDRQTITAVDAGPGAPAPAEGATAATADGYCALMLDGRLPNAVPDTAAHPGTAAMTATSALPIGSYYGVPVHLPDGALYGTLCGLRTTATPDPTSAQRQAMATIAGLLGQRLGQEREFARVQEASRAAFLPLLDSDRSTVVVQPIVDLATGTTVGFEALSRFTDPGGAPRRPDQVFAEAALVGLGVRFELAAARAALDLLPDLPPGTYLSVNLSPQAVCDPRTYDLLHDLALDRVVVELTEHDQVEDYTTIVHALAALRARGLRLAIDDAGSGFAGLHHLAELSPDLIKLDIAFVRDIDTDPVRRAVARALIGFAAEVGATLIAEGIETPAELDELRRLGAPLGQGFLLARPGPPRELLTGAARAARTARTDRIEDRAGLSGAR